MNNKIIQIIKTELKKLTMPNTKPWKCYSAINAKYL